MQLLLGKLDIIEYYQQIGRKYHLSEIIEKQRKLYNYVDIEVST